MHLHSLETALCPLPYHSNRNTKHFQVKYSILFFRVIPFYAIFKPVSRRRVVLYNLAAGDTGDLDHQPVAYVDKHLEGRTSWTVWGRGLSSFRRNAAWGQRVYIILGKVNNRSRKVLLARRKGSYPSPDGDGNTYSGISRGLEQKPKRITREPTELN